MMKTHRSSRARMLAGAAAILALGGLSLAFGSPGLAEPDAQAQTQTTPPAASPATPQRREERIIIRTDHDGRTSSTEHHGTGGTPDVRRERVMIMTDHNEGDHAHGGGGGERERGRRRENA